MAVKIYLLLVMLGVELPGSARSWPWFSIEMSAEV